MPWVTPVTDRSGPNTRTAWWDMDRIAGNINWLLGTSLKDNYIMGARYADIVTKAEWDDIVSYSQQMDHFGLSITDSTLYSNLNNIEKVALYYSDWKPTRLAFKLAQTLGTNKL